MINIRKVLNDKYLTHNKVFSLRAVKQMSDLFFGLDIMDKSQKRKYVDARKMYFGFVDENTKQSSTTIGKSVGKDHATVLHQLKKHKDLMKYNKKYQDLYKKYQKVIVANN